MGTCVRVRFGGIATLGVLAAVLCAACTATAATGNVRVTLSPGAAAGAGAQWRIDGGVWRKSGTTATGIVTGTHVVSYRSIAGWTAPPARSIGVSAGTTTNVIGTYTAVSGVGAVAATLEPLPARTAGAKWRIDGGAWNDSGATLVNVSAGTHTLTFQSLSGWNTPASAAISVLAGKTSSTTKVYTQALGSTLVLAYNDLGMHCMNQDFSEFMILPPYNVVRAHVLQRGKSPKFIKDGVTVSYRIPGNTTSVSKTNFWTYAQKLLGVNLMPDVGLTGNRLTGNLKILPDEKRWEVTGIPITPIMDNGALDPYPLAEINVYRSGQKVAWTNTTVPVSWEISCDLCHTAPGVSVATDILRDHDRMHGTALERSKPVTCGACHAQPPLGLTGAPGVRSLSSSMHSAHAVRMGAAALQNECYACHPGFETQCQRDIHFAKGIDCIDCHGGMSAVGNPARRSWVDEPKCGSCHQRAEFSFEEPGKLYRESRGHHEIDCAVCHGSPHAITPTVNAADNVQMLMMQGKAGALDTCTVCHITKPEGKFEHHL